MSEHHHRRWMAGWLLAGLAGTISLMASAAPPDVARQDLERRLQSQVKPVLTRRCFSCHAGTKPQAQFRLDSITNISQALREFAHLELAVGRVTAGQMPPKGAPNLTPAEKTTFLNWVRDVRVDEARRNAGDPGLVSARRLSNAEYDYSVRDLTGVDLRPTREFPVDPANQEGFDNTGESLTISPALLKKYVHAAREVSNHLVLTPSGIGFASHPMLAETDRDKYGILRIVEFYKRQPTDLAAYFLAAWKFRHRARLGEPNVTLVEVAKRSRISPRYLSVIWEVLSRPGSKVGPMAGLQTAWAAMPAPDPKDPGNHSSAVAVARAMRDWVGSLRKKLAWRFENLRLPGIGAGGQCFILWKNRQYASHRRSYHPDALEPGGIPKPRRVPNPRPNQPPQYVTPNPDPDLFIPANAAAQAPYLASFREFSSIFPDAFYISERGRMYIDDPNDRGRLLSAGFHNMMGYFRDDTPLQELILDDAGKAELNRLWREFDFIAQIPERMHLEFIFYERAESKTITGTQFDFARSEDKDAISEAKIRRLGEVYFAMAERYFRERGGDPEALGAIREHFERTNANIRAIERDRLQAEPVHLKSLLEFARRAYRRPLTEPERTELSAFYRTLRDRDGLSHEESVRDVLASILVSPNFLFRVDLDEPGGPVGQSSAKGAVQPLSDHALASRLSYFLWSSIPDDRLLNLAGEGKLRQPAVLAAEARRMLADPRARALALEFGGNWLDYRRFDVHNAVDRGRFPQFTDGLRQSMFEEPIRFLQEMFRTDGSIMDLLFGNYTFVNADLAKHYGMTGVQPNPDEWVRVPNAEQFGRGGLLPMGVFLTQNSPGLRTSPVKRGYWVVRRVLGEQIPAPPPVVPELPKDEQQLGDRTLRQVLARHREDPACSGCHARFDSYGLVFEGFGPVGERRQKDLGGRTVDVSAPFPGGDYSGLAGLRKFLAEKRQGDFLENFCRKLVSYGLGRSLQTSDTSLLTEMKSRLVANRYRVWEAVDTVVKSNQFRTRRVSPALAER